jgi:hypothetical protein
VASRADRATTAPPHTRLVTASASAVTTATPERARLIPSAWSARILTGDTATS